MKIVKHITLSAHSKTTDGEPFLIKKIAGKHDLADNVHFPEAMVRFGFTLLIPMVMLAIDKHLIIYTAPLTAYLSITALACFCIVKYAWHRYVKHEPPPALPAYGKDPDYPEESTD